MPKRVTQSKLFWGFIFLLFFEGISGIYFSLIVTNFSEQTFRNANFRRGWAEYTNISKTENRSTKRIILVSNSQGFGRELEEEYIYPKILSDRLNSKRKAEYELHNWSIPGAGAPELLIATTLALSYKPEIVLLVISATNFTRSRTQRIITDTASDMPLALVDPKLLLALPPKFVTQHIDINTFGELLITRYSRLLRLRDYFWSKLKWKIDLPYEMILGSGHYRQRSYWFKVPKFTPTIEDAKRRASMESIDYQYLQYFNAVFADSPSTQAVVVAMPIQGDMLKRDAWKKYTEFRERIQTKFEATNTKVWDFTETLDKRKFFSIGHLDQGNHSLFSELLFQRLMLLEN